MSGQREELKRIRCARCGRSIAEYRERWRRGGVVPYAVHIYDCEHWRWTRDGGMARVFYPAGCVGGHGVVRVRHPDLGWVFAAPVWRSSGLQVEV